MRAAREAAVVGVQAGDVARPVAPRGGALDLFLVCMVRREEIGDTFMFGASMLLTV